MNQLLKNKKLCIFTLFSLIALTSSLLTAFSDTFQFFLCRTISLFLDKPSDWILEKILNYRFRPLILFLMFISVVIYFFSGRTKDIRNYDPNIFSQQRISIQENLSAFFFLLLSTFLILSVCATSSFLYPWNVWDDSNIFLTMGKAVFSDKVIYRDLFEQKGPLLYFLHSFSYLISKDSFHGVFFIELLSALIFLFFAYKTLRLFTPAKILYILPLLTAFIYASHNFKYGDCAEEFALPFLMYTIYVVTKSIILETEIKKHEVFLIGLFAGCVCLIKFTILAFFMVFPIIPSYIQIKKGKAKSIILYFLMFNSGFVLSFLPFIAYFIAKDALYDFINVYFIQNFLYARNTNGIKTIIHNISYSFLDFIHRNLALAFVYFVSFFSLSILKAKKLFKINFIILAVFLFFIITIGVADRYYTVVMAPFTIFACIPIYRITNYFSEKIKRLTFPAKKQVIATFFILIGLLYSLATYEFTYLIGVKKEDLIPYKYNLAMREYKDNPSLLVYNSLHAEYYNFADIIPDAFAFVKFSSNSPLIKGKQQEYVEKGIYDFIVSGYGYLEEKDFSLLEKHYSLIRDDLEDFYAPNPTAAYLFVNKRLLKD